MILSIVFRSNYRDKLFFEGQLDGASRTNVSRWHYNVWSVASIRWADISWGDSVVSCGAYDHFDESAAGRVRAQKKHRHDHKLSVHTRSFLSCWPITRLEKAPNDKISMHNLHMYRCSCIIGSTIAVNISVLICSTPTILVPPGSQAAVSAFAFNYSALRPLQLSTLT